MGNELMKVADYAKDQDVTDSMNHLMSFLWEHGFVHTPEGCGFIEGSSAKCDFEIHIIRKR